MTDPDRDPLPNTPYDSINFEQTRVLDTWRRYADRLTWGRGQCLAILDDGCDMSAPQWQVEMPWGRKVIASYNSIDDNADPTPVPPGYHGTSVGYPSSLNHEGVLGVAYNNFVAQIRAVSIVHLSGQGEADTMATGLRWVLEHHHEYNITAVNLSPLDDEPHQGPLPTLIDGPLRALKEQGIWVSAPCGNNGYTNGISWPACQSDCFSIGATIPGEHAAHLDRFTNTDLLVAAAATSSSNAYAAACSMILREAIDVGAYPWHDHGQTMADAMLSIFQQTGVSIEDSLVPSSFHELDLLAAVDHVLRQPRCLVWFCFSCEFRRNVGQVDAAGRLLGVVDFPDVPLEWQRIRPHTVSLGGPGSQTVFVSCGKDVFSLQISGG